MADAPPSLLNRQGRSDWVRLRTLINLRWMAITGQTAAVMFATTYLGIALNIGLCMIAIGVSVVFNVASSVMFPKNKRMSERETMLTLLLDLSQLGFLVFLTGGLSNPFALLILAPVIIAATTLRQYSTLFLGTASVLMISFLAKFNVPLRTYDGVILKMADLFLYGFWIALIIGVVFLSGYARRVANETYSMSQALIATQMALSREQKLTDLGGVVAAAAHELGTPLATIKLVSTELADDLKDQPQLKEDADLIREQATRCAQILRDMGRTGKDDMLMHHAPISAVIREAAEPHESRGKTVHFDFSAHKGANARQPRIRRRPEIIHGIRNLIQNAVDFATANVWVDVRWSNETISVTVADDGPGYPGDMLGRIGDPFVRRRRRQTETAARPEYQGMGLGLFIAKTLLERSGAELTFANASDPFLRYEEIPVRSGAVVEVIWPRTEVEQSPKDASGPLGKNTALKI
ncbi:MAG: ActS/PrrB/RegB family redox-sensitive histidine kinase [Rhodobacteraceae bacterium]|nr:ActS/PrrB/RegB family redox-sensitive histidine kinase [Paracoccaceae bacterium]